MTSRPALPAALSLILAIAAGLLIGAGQAPMGVWPATLAGLALFTWLMTGRRLRPSFGLGYLAGLAMNTLTVSWVSVLGAWVGVALVAFLALWWGLLAMAISRLTDLRAWPVLIPAAWVAMEFLSGKVPFGGFAWTRLAYTTIDQPVAGWLPWIGAAGVTYLTALVAHLLLWALVDKRRRLAAVAGTLAVFLLGGLANLIPPSAPDGHVTIAMVQPNVNRHEHGTSSYARSVTNNALSETIFALAEARTSGTALDFVLWPENATDVDPILDAETRGLVELAVTLAEVPVFVGAVTDGPEPDTRQTSSIWWDPQTGPGAEYHKRDLVPFGEWIPFRDVLLPRLPILEQIGRQSVPGTGPGVVLAPVASDEGLSVGTIICFELAYDDTSYDVVRGGADVVVSQSNTNTYGATFQPYQQLVINRVRAKELGRDIAVSTLNSISAHVDATGRVHDPTPEFVSATRIIDLERRTSSTPAVLLSPWTSYLALGVTVVALGLASGRRGRRGG